MFCYCTGNEGEKVRKIQTSINLEPEIKNIVDTEGLNLSQFVGEQLEKYFSVSTVEDINSKISGHKAAILALEQKRADLLERGSSETVEEAITKKTLDVLKEVFMIRMSKGGSHEMNVGWISSPKNLVKCKQLGKDPLDVLGALEAWYLDLQKN